ncbi:MAG TPA: PEGA domain-containing protein [Vicinamibacterales bacterium]|nr:PEGA domain-containing protein [Vicinamibacterales bacterium]
MPPRVYNNYYYYPRRSYPYGYGGFGLGYFYYDPYLWDPYYDSYGYSSYAAPFRGYGYGYASGELRLDVRPRDAEVYVDGYYAGRVDEFDGVFQSLTLEEGAYRVEIVAPGYEPLDFDVRIIPGRKTTYRGDLLRGRP